MMWLFFTAGGRLPLRVYFSVVGTFRGTYLQQKNTPLPPFAGASPATPPKRLYARQYTSSVKWLLHKSLDLRYNHTIGFL